jgi:hypothetical protein
VERAKNAAEEYEIIATLSPMLFRYIDCQMKRTKKNTDDKLKIQNRNSFRILI